jgi:hypothetical protein
LGQGESWPGLGYFALAAFLLKISYRWPGWKCSGQLGEAGSGPRAGDRLSADIFFAARFLAQVFY